jgi:hypothetical protein
MPDDTRTVPVTFQLDPETATALADPATRARVERLIRRTTRSASVDRLFDAIATLKEDAHRKGLTDEIVDAELAAYNAEHRERRSAG